jgi:hypothetical protein
MGKMRILNSRGDTTVKWSVDDPASILVAERRFNEERDRRCLAFARPDGGTAEDAARIYSFDPEVNEIIWIRPIAGG